nr:helix-turn-helix domain-containing protein [Lachnospiraceae bacterium]
SKWENGNNVPDVLTMMELANFFNISVDELLGFDISSKNVDDMCDSIEKLYDAHDYVRAQREANEAMTRYPHNFKVLYTCATLYFFKATEEDDDKDDAETAIRIYKQALSYISQNTVPEISEFSIKERIANMYRKIDPEKALDQLKEINYDGTESALIAATLMKLERRSEALNYYSTAILICFVKQYELSANTALALASTGKKEDIKKAHDLIETELGILDLYAIPQKITFIYKLKSLLLIYKAWGSACLGMTEDMKKCVEEAYALAKAFDDSKVRSEVTDAIKYVYFSKDMVSTHDSIGPSAESGIEALFKRKHEALTEKNAKYLSIVADYWNEIKNKK